ncbi:hypothetical protein KXQ82_04230 [Mucilaginibacter sp. HMF5004]|uniref:NB-ARC domain-containing protein n=1 Tax=Mucilaginibacter rivuli TaxID=2857527 RepID=UPI001C5F1BF7|nr:NB-ARC domain-containing protein [Mucilaginibacter rivuli]MBW4888904.1 hypothetical protein [Mucilaginibacter rivuli]
MTIPQTAIRLLENNRDAAAVNRGFYYQYLNVLKKWVDNFISDNTSNISTEVGDDIKEVNGRIVFTQVKCYSSTFNLKSKEVHKALLNFFSLYLAEHCDQPELQFVFLTNTAIAHNEHLLKNWIAAWPLEDKNLTKQCTAKIIEILRGEVNKLKAQRLAAKKITQLQKEEIKSGADGVRKLLTYEFIGEFVKCIRWDFGNKSPEQSIAKLTKNISGLLDHAKFRGRPVSILMNVLLSEIYRCSQMADPGNRVVNSGLLDRILDYTDEDLKKYVNRHLLDLFDDRFKEITAAVHELQEIARTQAEVQATQGAVIANLVKVFKPQSLPKLLTPMPFLNRSNLIARDSQLNEIESLLNEDRQVAIIGEGGMGKTTLAAMFVHRQKENYDHIIWLNAESGLVHSMTLNEHLTSLLQLELRNAEEDIWKLQQIVQRLISIEGRNLLILNGIGTEDQHLIALLEIDNWEILVTTRSRPKNLKPYPLQSLSFEQASSLFAKYESSEQATETLQRAFFELVDYNTLMIELVAKTIRYSFDLTLKKFLQYFEHQQLNHADMQVELPVNGKTDTDRLFPILLRTFDLSKLENDESQYFIELFALLPGDEIKLSDLVDWYGPQYVEKNKVDLTNAINKMHERGLINRDGDTIRMHKIFQQAILYQSRQAKNPFAGQLFHLVYLTARIREGARNNPKEAIRFLLYGESILNNIKEPFRRSIYQPLLALENETLNVFNWLITPDHMVNRWKNLAQRAEAYFNADEPLLGVIFNNYALALAGQENTDEAIFFFEKAIAVMKHHEAKLNTQLITALCNLAQLFVVKNDLAKFKVHFDEAQAIRKRQDASDDVSLPMQSNVMGNANLSIKNFRAAIEMYEMAVALHLELPPAKRNDINLVMYYTNLANAHLLNNDNDMAHKAVMRAINVMDKLESQNTKITIGLIDIMILLAKADGNEENAAALIQSRERLLEKVGLK